MAERMGSDRIWPQTSESNSNSREYAPSGGVGGGGGCCCWHGLIAGTRVDCGVRRVDRLNAAARSTSRNQRDRYHIVLWERDRMNGNIIGMRVCCLNCHNVSNFNDANEIGAWSAMVEFEVVSWCNAILLLTMDGSYVSWKVVVMMQN